MSDHPTTRTTDWADVRLRAALRTIYEAGFTEACRHPTRPLEEHKAQAASGQNCRVDHQRPLMPRRFTTRWLPLREADRFIAKHHRHHDPAQGGIVALGLWEGTDLVGVGVLGRPVSRMLQQQGAAEIVRLCVPRGCTACGFCIGGTAAARRTGARL
jgi:hypothetical protein